MSGVGLLGLTAKLDPAVVGRGGLPGVSCLCWVRNGTWPISGYCCSGSCPLGWLGLGLAKGSGPQEVPCIRHSLSLPGPWCPCPPSGVCGAQ